MPSYPLTVARIFTLKENEPVCIPGTRRGDLDKWVVLPAGTALAVAESQRIWHRLSDDGAFVPVEPFTEDVDLVIYADGTVGELPVEVGVFGEGEPDDLCGFPLLTGEEAVRLHPEFADAFAELEPDPEFEEMERTEAELDRQWEAMADVEAREGRLSATYRAQLQSTPFGVQIQDLAEIAELYNDDLLRQAIGQHPDMDAYEWSDDEAKRGAALGLVSRMLVAEAILQPGVRQADLKGPMGISSGPQTERTYPLGKAGFLKRTSEKTQVFLAPGDRVGELGLDASSAAELIAWRDGDPEAWDEIIDRATHRVERNVPESSPWEPDPFIVEHDDGSIPFGPDAPSARAWPRVPDAWADNPHILRWWTPACDEAIREQIQGWRWHYPWKLTDAVVAVVGKEAIDSWAAQDPKCQEYAYYNVLMYFGIARARRVGLERELPMPEERVCRRCGKSFHEDLVPMRQVREGSTDAANNCGKC